MKYVTEFQDRKIAEKIIGQIKECAGRTEVSFMEVCGTHTVAIFKHGIRHVLPNNIKLISGPGCPVCVTDAEDIDRAIAVARLSRIIFTTFGDMLKVPGSELSLSEARSAGADVRVVYSCLDALKIARENPGKEVVFFGIGFETTSPTIAATLIKAKKEKVRNFSILSSFKLIPPALGALLTDRRLKVGGFILPGHVSTVIGAEPYRYVVRDYGISCVIAGFEPLDILSSILMLLKQRKTNSPGVEIQYTRSVRPEGNPVAKDSLKRVFAVGEVRWRGLGVIPGSGLRLKKEYRGFCAKERFPVKVKPAKKISGCRCDEVLKGIISPPECSFFRKACNPESPLGPCMVSSEGTCAAYYKYGV